MTWYDLACVGGIVLISLLWEWSNRQLRRDRDRWRRKAEDNRRGMEWLAWELYLMATRQREASKLALWERIFIKGEHHNPETILKAADEATKEDK